MKKKGVPVLMYHALEDAQHPAGYTEPGDKVYVLQTEQFREQMEYLRDQGFKTYLINELFKLEELPDKAVVLTFDDGHESNATVALPILQGFGFKAEFFITTGWINTLNFMQKEQIRDLHQAGMGIGGHGVTHRFLSDLSVAEMHNEITDSKNVLEACICAPITMMSYPGGRMNQQTENLARSVGWRHICSSVPKLHQFTLAQLPIPRLTVKADLTLDLFEQLLLGDGLKIQYFRYRFLATAKAFLGNRLYTRLRTILIRSE